MTEITKVLCNQEIAANIDKRLRNQARGVAHSMERFKSLINEAKTRHIYPMLGFKSWTTYITDVINKEMHQLPVDDRRQIVALLASEGMSNRVIADAVGVNEITVRRDKEQVRQNVAPDDLRAVDELISQGAVADVDEYRDIMAMAELSDGEFDAVLTDARAAGDLSRENVAHVCRERNENMEQKPIVGRDGKSYPAKPPRPRELPKRRRGPISDTARSVGLELGRINKRLEKLLDDDRFGRNREVIGSQIRPGVKFMLDVLGRLDGEINPIPDVSQYGNALPALMRQTVSPYRLAQLHAADRRELLLIMREAVKELDHLEGGDPLPDDGADLFDGGA
jgi:hypothetical protein